MSAVKVEFIVVMPGLRRPTLAGQMLVLQLAIIVAVLVAVGALSLAQSQATFTRVEGRRIAALAEQLAINPLVRNNLAVPELRTGLATLAQTVVTQSRVSDVTIADTSERVRVSTIPSLEDEALPLGAPQVAQGASWQGVLELGGARQLVAQVPVLSVADQHVGDHLGTVMVAEDFPSVWERLAGASSYLLTYLSIALAIGLLGSWLLARRIKRQTLGLEPHEITGLAEHREALLYGIAEGVIALDPSDRVTLVNDVARRLLDLPEHSVGTSLRDLRVGGRLYDVLTGRGDGGADSQADAAARDEVVIRRGHVLVMNRMRVTKDGRELGSVTTLRDRTELADLEREIGAFRSSTELLRAQAHEFANQLHTISGLIQLGDYDEVVRYVDTLSRDRASLDTSVTRRLHDPAVAALVMAKASQAAERRVVLRLSDASSLWRLAPHDSADVAAVLGNLVDNAIDAAVEAARDAAPRDAAARDAVARDAGARDAAARDVARTGDPDSRQAWVEVELRQDASSVEISVSDSGPGVAPELAREVFAHGFTTKAATAGERGIGLALTRLICQRRGGEVVLTNTDDGARFSARLGVSTLVGADAEPDPPAGPAAGLTPDSTSDPTTDSTSAPTTDSTSAPTTDPTPAATSAPTSAGPAR
ncbi:MAG TPA: ATP-binding protein [Dermatophilaceae bacterium]|nr:ATP-binding protein [Dermatophilaceae bacterium]